MILISILDNFLIVYLDLAQNQGEDHEGYVKRSRSDLDLRSNKNSVILILDQFFSIWTSFA